MRRLLTAKFFSSSQRWRLRRFYCLLCLTWFFKIRTGRLIELWARSAGWTRNWPPVQFLKPAKMKILFCSEPLEPQLNRLVCRTEDDFSSWICVFLITRKILFEKSQNLLFSFVITVQAISFARSTGLGKRGWEGGGEKLSIEWVK